MVYDSYYGMVLLALPSGSLWAYSDRNWTEVLSSGPCGGSSGAGQCFGAYDSSEGAVVEYRTLNGTSMQATSDVWLFGSGIVSVAATPSGDGSISVNDSAKTITYGSETPELGFGNYSVAAQSELWARFAHWTTTGNLTLQTESNAPSYATAGLTVMGNGSLKAVFRPAPFISLAVDPALCGPITFNGQTYPNGSRPEFIQGTYAVSVSCSDYHFYRWEGSSNVTVGSSTTSSTSVSLVGGNGTLEAVFALNITLSIDPASYGSVVLNGTNFPNGATWTLPVGNFSLKAVPDAWGKFTGWSQVGVGLQTGNDSVWVRGPGDTILQAHFALFPALTVAINLPKAADTSCRAYELDNTSQNNGSVVHLTLGLHWISAREVCEYTAESQFYRWEPSTNITVASPTNSTSEIEVKGNGSVTATYEDAYWVGFSAQGGIGGTIRLNGSAVALGSQLLLTNGTFILTGTPASGYRLAGWNASGSVQVGNGILRVEGSGTVTADFARIGPPVGNSTPPSAPFPWIIVAGIGAAAVFVAVGVIVVHKRRRR